MDIFFHEERNKVDGMLATEWKKMLLILDIKISDPTAMQSVSQQLFEEPHASTEIDTVELT